MLARLIKIGFGTLAVLFLVAPLFAILPLAFTSSVFLTYPIPDWSTRWFQELATADAWRRSIINSLMIGGGTTLLATILGTMAALGLRQQGMRFAAPLRTLFILPMVVPAVVLGVGMQLLFAQLGLANTYLGVIVAHSIVAIPLVFITVSGAVAGLDKRVELAAESLGASPDGVQQANIAMQKHDSAKYSKMWTRSRCLRYLPRFWLHKRGSAPPSTKAPM